MNQQHPFFFSGFCFFNLLEGTSTGINLSNPNHTSLPACSQPTQARSSRTPPPPPPCSWPKLSNAWSSDASTGTPGPLTPPPHVTTHGRSYFRWEWKGIFMAPWERPGWGTQWSTSRCCRRTAWGHIYAFVGDIVDKDATISPSVEGPTQAPKLLLSCRVPNLNSGWRTSRLMTFPSTITSFSMKSAPTVAL